MAFKKIFASITGAVKTPAKDEINWQSLSDDLDRLCQTLIFSIKIDAHDKQQVLVASLYIKILSNFQAILLLVDKELINESRTLVRGMMEAMFALTAIANDNSIAQRFIDNDHTQRMKLSITYEDLPFKLKRALKPRVTKLLNSSLNGMTSTDNKTLNISQLTVEQLAKIGGLQEIYYSIYMMLSGCNYLRVRELEQYWNSNHSSKSLLTLVAPDNRKAEAVLYTTIKTIFLTLNGLTKTFDINVPKEYSLLVKQFRKLAATSRNKARKSPVFDDREKSAKA